YSYPYGYDEGYLWCLPWNFATESLFYNKSHFLQAGIAFPDESWTWENLRHAALALTTNASTDGEPKRWGVELQLNNLDYVLRSFGGGFLIEGERDEVKIGRGNVSALRYVADLILKDQVHPYPTPGWREGFGQGRVSMAFLPERAAVSLNAVYGLDFDVAPVPQGPEGRVTSFSATGIGMGWHTDWEEGSWELMKWFAHADGGEWAVARALLILGGSPVSLQSANEFLWNDFVQEPENRSVFLQNLEYAMVPFSGEEWWPFFDEDSLFNFFEDDHLRKEVQQSLQGIWEGTAAVDELAKELYERWKSIEWYWP
ncbi:MAG: extracellular solute-binding protein, partial [Chloroflexi bacterium]|nr:extracellular solute-binding protein [Chloroflexota bacterium]